jgi:CBS domain-containing protein
MGLVSTVIAFGAGYLTGAKRDSAMVQQVRDRVRGTVSQRMGRLSEGGQSTGDGLTDIRQVSEVMTATPETVGPDTTLVDAARRMRDGDFGDVLVVESGTQDLIGIVTDRDITIRAVAGGRDPNTTTVRSILSGEPQTVSPTDTIDVAKARMRAANVRRLPVIEDGRVVGIVSLGDLSIATDAGATLADISVASPDR